LLSQQNIAKIEKENMKQYGIKTVFVYRIWLKKPHNPEFLQESGLSWINLESKQNLET
jgi:hypothetical protein